MLTKKRNVIILIMFLVIGMLFVFLLPNEHVIADTNNSIVKSVDESSIEKKCKDFTNNKINWDALDKDHIEKYIPIELFQQVGVYGYIGKHYGFAVVVDYDNIGIAKYYARVLLLDVEFENYFATSSAHYKITPKKYLQRGFDKFLTDKIDMDVAGTRQLLLGDIILMPEFNTVNELSRGQKNYDITKDNSNFIEYANVNYTMEGKNTEGGILSFVSVLNTLIGSSVDAYLEGFPASQILSLMLSIPNNTIVNKGINVNSLSYAKQIENNRLENSCAIYMGEDKYLAVGHNNEIDLTIKYDNKMHSAEDFQLGMKIGFNIYEEEPYIFNKKKLTEEMIDCHSVFDFYSNNENYSLCANEIYLENDKIVEKYRTNKFFNNYQGYNLEFVAPENRLYNLYAPENTVLSQNFINATKGQAYNITFGMNNTDFGQILVGLNNQLNLGSNTIYEGFSVYNIDCTQTDVYKYIINSDIGLKNIYITDEQGNILNKVSSKNYITYVLHKNNKYKLYIESEDCQNVELVEQINNEQRTEIAIEDGEKYFFTFESLITNYFNFIDNDFIYKIYDESFNLLEDRLLERNKKYIFEILKANSDLVNCDFNFVFSTIKLKEEFGCIERLNEIFCFTPTSSMTYVFGDTYATFDIYNQQGELIANQINSCYLEKGNKYYIINYYNQNKICIDYKIVEINFKTENNLERGTIYKFYNSEYGLYSTIDYNIISVYDDLGGIIEYNNGYRLYEGDKYIISTDNVQINFKENLITVNVVLANGSDLQIVTVNYGYQFEFYIPEKQGHIFKGWTLDNKLITNEFGQGLDLWNTTENMILYAEWAVKDLYITLNNNGEILWVDNEGNITTDQEGAKVISIEQMNSIISKLLGLVYGQTLVYEGHWKTIELQEMVETDNSFISNLNVVWTAEEYLLTFDGVPDAKIKCTYGQEITDFLMLLEYQNNINYTFNYWKYNDIKLKFFNGQKHIATDFTQNEENNKVRDIHFIADRVAKSAQVNLIINKINSKGEKVSSEALQKKFIIDQIYYIYDIIDITHYTVEEFVGANIIANEEENKFTVVSINNPHIILTLQAKRYEIVLQDLNKNYELFGRFVKDFINYYDITNPVIALPSVKKDRTNHTKWNVVGTYYGFNETITIPEEHIGNLIIKPIFEDDIINVQNNNTYNLSENLLDYYNCITLDLTGCDNNITVLVGNEIEHVRFRGNGEQISNIFIEIDSNLIINVDFINCNFLGKKLVKIDNDKKIDTGFVVITSYTDKVNLYFSGNNILRQADFDKNINQSLCSALITFNSNLYSLTKDAKLTLYGGNGKGNDGVDGIDAGHAWIGPLFAGKAPETNIYLNVELYAGSGSNGKDSPYNYTNCKAEYGKQARNGGNGGRGGHSGNAFVTSANIMVAKGYTVNGYTGRPGHGGKGGDGEEGADAKWLGPSSLPGGNGGNGGNAGISSRAFVYENKIIEGKLTAEIARIGLGGPSGKGGLGGRPLVGDRRPSGKDGVVGTSSWGDTLN